MDLLIDIGDKIKDLRKKENITQELLASNSGVERSQLSRIEKGEVKGVSLITIEKILNSLNYQISIEKIKNNNQYYNIHPFVKWAGGKTQILDELIKYVPKSYNTYYEPFVGGGALLFKLQPYKFVINDTNKELIDVYSCFLKKDLYLKLIEELKKHENNHNEEYYYKIRDLDRNTEEYNRLKIYEKAARILYLNKSCFNGLYRVNSKGFFNVPSGKKVKVKCYDENNFKEIRKFFNNRKDSIVASTDYEDVLKNVRKGDFIYFDPPYDTLDDKNSFTSYNKDSFGKEEQARLASVFKRLNDKGAYVMLSNHNTKYIRELYKDFNIHIIHAKRMINSKGDGRGEVEEVIITNYEK